MSHSRWHLPAPVPDSYTVSALGFSRLMAQLLYNRGLTDSLQIQSFLAADSSLSANPFLLPDMSQAVARIYRALLSGEDIAVYGDFDVDGITATALLVQGLSALGGRIIPYIPHRLTEGYGLKIAALENLCHQGVSLVITVDCGISALKEVKRARRIGLDIIITDHHTIPPQMPPAVAIVNPKRTDSNYPFSELAGVGVAFKLLQALFQATGREEQLDELTDLVALGTVADIVPLLGENRYLVKQGLKLINTAPRLGIREVMVQSGLSPGSFTSDRISWIVAPQLNAAGRLAHAMTSYRLLVADCQEEAHQLAIWLEQKNAERRKLTERFLAKAIEQVLAQGISPLLIVEDKDCPVGIAGLIASRLSEEFCRPAIVVKTGEKMSRGSCRSIPQFNIIQALTQCSSLLSQFGGHSQAAGFTLLTRNLPSLEQHLSQMTATQLAGVDLRHQLDIDAVVTLLDLGGDTFQMIQKLAPFGYANPDPVFLSRNVEVVDCRTFGNNDGHLRLKLRQGGMVWDGVGFGLGNYLTEVSSPLNIVYNLEVDRWGGEETLRLNILDFGPSR